MGVAGHNFNITSPHRAGTVCGFKGDQSAKTSTRNRICVASSLNSDGWSDVRVRFQNGGYAIFLVAGNCPAVGSFGPTGRRAGRALTMSLNAFCHFDICMLMRWEIGTCSVP